MRMTDETFIIRAYGKSELAMMYFPNSSKETAMKKMKYWLNLNPNLRNLKPLRAKFYTPKQVQLIVEELGEPFDTE